MTVSLQDRESARTRPYARLGAALASAMNVLLRNCYGTMTPRFAAVLAGDGGSNGLAPPLL